MQKSKRAFVREVGFRAVDFLWSRRSSMTRPATAAVVFVAILLIAAYKQDEKVATDKQTLQGTWEYVSATRGGKPYEEPIGVRITFAGDSITRVIVNKTHEHKYKLSPNKTPKEISFIAVKDGKDEVSTGIYSLDGDTLKWCFNLPGKPIPTTFASKEGDELTLCTLKRVKLEKR
jgi:uncharacterized protein (TIGR03067 family)